MMTGGYSLGMISALNRLGLVGLWALDSQDSQAIDLSGHCPPGTVYNKPTVTVTPKGKMLAWNGTNQYANLGTPDALKSIQVPLTILAWLVITTSSTNGAIFTQYASITNHKLIKLFGAASTEFSYYFSTSTGGYQFFKFSSVPALNVPHCLVARMSGKIASPSLSLFSDGVRQDFTPAALSATPDTTVPIMLGADATGSAYAPAEFRNGVIGTVMVFNQALPDLTIQQLTFNPGAFAQSGKLAEFVLKILVLAEAVVTTSANSLALTATNLLSLGLTEATPIASAVALTETLGLLLQSAESTPSVSPLALQQAAALVCVQAISTPSTDAIAIAQALLLVIEQAGSTPTAVPLTLAGQIALTLARATSTPTADDVIIRSELALQLEQAISWAHTDALALQALPALTVTPAESTPRALSLALTEVLIGLGKLLNPNLRVATMPLSLHSATVAHTLRKV